MYRCHATSQMNLRNITTTFLASLCPAPCNMAYKDLQQGIETEQDTQQIYYCKTLLHYVIKNSRLIKTTFLVYANHDEDRPFFY